MEEVSEILKKNGFAFKKKFGQNFIADPNLLEAIVRDAGIDKTTSVLEIGTGAGALTRALSKAANRVISYEIDRSLAPVLSETLAGCENTEVVFGDFMRADLTALESSLGPYAVCANLPYYVTTPVLLRFPPAFPPRRTRPTTARSRPPLPTGGRAGSSERSRGRCFTPVRTWIPPSCASISGAGLRWRARGPSAKRSRSPFCRGERRSRTI